MATGRGADEGDPGQSPPARYDALVLGVGGMGAAALAHLAARGLRVLGVEQDDVPSLRGSSVGETRVIRKAYFEDPRYVPLLERSYALWRDLERDAGETLMVRTGCLTLGPPDHEALRGVLESVARHRLPHARLDAAQVRAAFPALSPSPGDVGVLEEDAGYLHVEACTRAHARRAVAAGAELRTRTAVTELSLEGGVRAGLSDGTRVEAPAAVMALGPWLGSSPALASVAAELPPVVIERQVQLWFPPVPGPLPAFVHFTGDRVHYGIPTAESLKACRHHGGELTSPEALDRTVRPDDEASVRQYLRAHLPAADAPALRGRVCMYTSTPDHHFLVGRLARWPHVVLLGGFSGHGYKMAPVMGQVAAELVAGEPASFDLTMFEPGRFGAPGAP